MLDLDSLDFGKGSGFVTVVAQHARTRAVLMVARADREALERTLASGEMHYHSRSRGAWHKGATSGNVQRVVALVADCDRDTVLALVEPAGPACHTGAATCFEGEHVVTPEERASWSASDVLDRLAATIAARAARSVTRREPASDGRRDSLGNESGEPVAEAPSYTRRLLADRNLRLKKLGEEAAELAVACADGDAKRAAEEGADLLYHVLVALAAVDVTLDDVRAVLHARERA